MHEKLTQNKAYHRRLVKRRSSTVEPVLGTLINHHNMRRINSRGMPQANKHIMMAALTYNLKKYLRFVVKKPSVLDRKSTRLNSSHVAISYAVFCLKKKNRYRIE